MDKHLNGATQCAGGWPLLRAVQVPVPITGTEGSGNAAQGAWLMLADGRGYEIAQTANFLKCARWPGTGRGMGAFDQFVECSSIFIEPNGFIEKFFSYMKGMPANHRNSLSHAIELTCG